MIVGYVGPFGDSNFGDYAMFINDVLDINEKNIKVFSYNEKVTDSICKIYLQDFDYKIIPVRCNSKYKEIESNVYSVDYDTYPYNPMEILQKIENIKSVNQEIFYIDILIVVGGGYFNKIWNAKHRQYKLFSIMATILSAVQFQKKIVFMGNTYGPFLESACLFSNFFAILENPILGSRDNIYSPIWFRQLGTNYKLTILPDDLYFLNQKLTFQKKFQKTINNNYILLEVYYSIQELEKNIELYRNFIHQIKEKYGYQVIFLPFDKKYGGEYQGKFLKENIPELIFYSLEQKEFLTIEELLNLVINSKFIICNRYHLLLLALSNNIPVFQILKDALGSKQYYYCKSKGILTQLFGTNPFIDNDFLKLSVKETFEQLLQNLNYISEKQKKYYNETKRKNEKNMKKIRESFISKEIKIFNKDE